LSSPLADNGYISWTSQVMHGHVGVENSRFTTGPAPAGAAQPSPGEQMAYWCGNTNPVGASPPILARLCYRSFDGGTSWHQASVLYTALVAQHSECGSDAESFSAGDGNYPQAAPDGSLWLMVVCGGTSYLAKSTDEAATFPILHKADGAPLTIPAARELRVDTDGNLYAMRIDGTSLLLRISRAGGQ